jgi:hypothetical protein
MKSRALSKNKDSTAARPSVPAAPSNQTTMAANPTRVEVTRNACAFYLTQGASAVSLKLITERASVSAPEFHEIDERYAAYAHGGLND